MAQRARAVRHRALAPVGDDTPTAASCMLGRGCAAPHLRRLMLWGTGCCSGGPGPGPAASADILAAGRCVCHTDHGAGCWRGGEPRGGVLAARPQSVTPTQFPQLTQLDFDPSADFHVYAIEWTPAGAHFSIDGAVRHVWTSEIERLKLPINILLTIWASSSAGWAGALDPGSVPVSADYDWLRVYRWIPG